MRLVRTSGAKKRSARGFYALPRMHFPSAGAREEHGGRQVQAHDLRQLPLRPALGSKGAGLDERARRAAAAAAAAAALAGAHAPHAHEAIAAAREQREAIARH